ncbi:MAG: hypothetical protein R2780_14730 [Crocinitomicaceae bacterium]
MKKLVTAFTLLITINSLAGGFRWPQVDYDHAKLFLFNINLEHPEHFNWHVYQDGVYAGSKIGEGRVIKQEDLDKLHSALVRGVHELHSGLSKCYTPRHGIIYYDKLGKPVASFSICLECEKISFWDIQKGQYPIEESNHFDLKKAQKQIDAITKFVQSQDFPVFQREEEYIEYISNREDLKVNGEMYMQMSENDSMSLSKYSIDDVKSWQVEIFHAQKLKQTEETKITAGGDKWTYQQLSTAKSRFIFSLDKEDPYLVEATIQDENILLPNGVSVGMSIDDVMNTFPIYDGIAWPELIQLKNDKLTIDYFFKNRTLVKISLQFSIV